MKAVCTTFGRAISNPALSTQTLNLSVIQIISGLGSDEVYTNERIRGAPRASFFRGPAFSAVVLQTVNPSTVDRMVRFGSATPSVLCCLRVGVASQVHKTLK